MVTRRRDVERMVDGQIRTRGLDDERVIDAMLQVPRHVFVSDAMQYRAYDDCPLPIGEGQTISQPYIVARMLELLQLQGDETVLEIGAGSGYQTALLSLLARRVVAIERIGTLARGARQRLDALDITNAVVVQADGTLGWSEEAPYQGVLIAAAAPAVPEPLLDQLDVGGHLVAPVGDRHVQDLQVVVREPDGFRVRTRGGCRFVPLLGRFGFEEI